MVILMCLKCLKSDRFKGYDTKSQFCEKHKHTVGKKMARHGSKMNIYQLLFFES